MARFARRRRRDDRADHQPDPWLDDPVPAAPDDPPSVPAPRGPRADRAPATRAASPAVWGRPEPEPAGLVDDPVTDPFGFPPVPPVVTAAAVAPEPTPTWAAWVPAAPDVRPGDDRRGQASAPPTDRDAWDPDLRAGSGNGRGSDTSGPTELPVGHHVASAAGNGSPRERDDTGTADGPADAVRGRPDGDPGPDPGPDPAEAAALAGAFAADFLSWDEDEPARRGRALADHLPGPAVDRALLGWSGGGRQRAEIALPGAVRRDDQGRLLVDVRVRVTPYRRVSRSDAAPDPEPAETLGTVASAPPVTARGWRGLAARWVRLVVTVARDGDRLVVDAGEETTGTEPSGTDGHDAAPARPRRTADDPTIDGDETDVVVGGRR